MNLNPTTVQTILFENSKWNVEEAEKWLLKHGKKATKVHITDNYLRFRQIDPKLFKKDSYSTIRFGKQANGILAVIGELKTKKNCACKNPMEIDKMSKFEPIILTGQDILSLLVELQKETNKVKTFKAKANKVDKALDSVNEKVGHTTKIGGEPSIFTQKYPDGDSAKIGLIFSGVGSFALIKPKGKSTKIYYVGQGLDHSDIQLAFQNKFMKEEGIEPVFFSVITKEKLKRNAKNPVYEVEPQDVAILKTFREGEFRDKTMKGFGITEEMLERQYGIQKINPKSAIVDLEPPQILVDNPDSALFDLEPPQILVDNPHCYGMVYHNPPKKITSLQSFYSNAQLGNIFAGASVIVVTEEGLKRLNSNGKLTHVSAPVAYYVDLAGEGYLVAKDDELTEVEKITTADIKKTYKEAIKYLKGSKGVSKTIKKPTKATSKPSQPEATATTKDVAKKDEKIILSSDVLDIYQKALEESTRTNKVSLDADKLQKMIDKLSKEEIALVRKSVKSRSNAKILEKMVQNIQSILDTAKEEREDKLEEQREEQAEEVAQSTQEKIEEQIEEEEEEELAQSDLADIVNEFNSLVSTVTADEIVTLPSALASKIDEHKEELQSSLDKLLVGKRDSVAKIAKMGSKVFSLSLKNISSAMKSADFQGEDPIAVRDSYKIVLKNPRNLGHNRSYIYPMSITDHNHQKYEFDMYSDEPIPNPTHHRHNIDSLGNWEEVLNESYDRVMKSKALPKSFFDLFTLIEYAPSDMITQRNQNAFNHHKTELLNMLGDISTAVEVDYDPKKLKERIYGIDYMGDSYFAVPKKDIDRFEIQRILSGYGKLQEHLRYLDYYIKKEKKNPSKKKLYRRNVSLQPYQKPQVEVNDVMIDQDIYQFFGDVYGYTALADNLELADDDEIDDIEFEMETIGDFIITAQQEIVPALEIKFQGYIQEGGQYPFQKQNPDHDWIQGAFSEMKEKGTAGSFTRYAKSKGVTTVKGRRNLAKKIKSKYEKWKRQGEHGRSPYSLKTYRRAVFLLNLER